MILKIYKINLEGTVLLYIMYWGTPDVSVSFCEDKYVVSNYIAEYYNTMSALSYVIVGLIFYRTRLKRSK